MRREGPVSVSKFASLALAVMLAALLWTTAAPSARADDLADFLKRIQSDDVATRRQAWENAGPLGAPAVRPLVEILAGQDHDKAKAAGWALNRIVHYAARPGAPVEQRRAVAVALAEALKTTAGRKVYFKLLDLLGAVADDATVADIAKLLRANDRHVREMARWALVNIPTPAATNALIDALDQADPKFRAHIIGALGQKRSVQAVDHLIRWASQGDDRQSSLEAIDALARIGDPRAEKVIERAFRTASDTDRARIRDACVRLADRLASTGRTDAAMRIYRAILAEAPDKAARCAALAGLARVGSLDIIDTVLPFTTDRSQDVRAVAINCLGSLEGDRATRALMERYRKAPPVMRASLLRVMAIRRPEGFQEFLQAAAGDSDAEVRVTALQLLGGLDDPSLEPTLLEAAERGSPQIKPVALRSYVKLAGARLARGEKQHALEMYHRALDLNPPEDVVLSALEGLRRIASEQSLSRVQALFGRPAVANEARRTFIAIAAHTGASGRKDRAINLLTDLVNKTRDPAIIRAAIDQLRKLGADTSGFATKVGFIARWHVIGPLPVNDRNPWDKSWLAEAGFQKADLEKPVPFGKKLLNWKEVRIDDPSGRVNLVPLFKPNTNVAAYAYAEIDSPRSRDIHLRIGSDDGVICWFNGKRVLANNVARSWSPDQDTVKVRLQKGVNRILLKIINGGGDWAFSVRLANTQNRPLDLTRFGM